jgi:hypothetical protein
VAQGKASACVKGDSRDLFLCHAGVFLCLFQAGALSDEKKRIRQRHKWIVDFMGNGSTHPLENREFFQPAQRFPGLPSLGYVIVHTDDAQWPAARIAMDPASANNPTHSAGRWSSAELNPKSVVAFPPAHASQDLSDPVSVFWMHEFDEFLSGRRT